MSDLLQVMSLFDAAPARAVDRAIAEFRAGRPVALANGAQALVVLLVDALSDPVAQALHDLAPGAARLVLPAARLRRLGAAGASVPASVTFATPDAARAQRLALGIEARLDAPAMPASPLEEAALELARLALLSPAVFVVPLAADALDASVVRVGAEDVMGYRATQVRSLRLVGRAPVPLEGAPDTEFAVFRGGEGLKDQVAIIVGKPDLGQPVSVRLHSACLTGDLFGSLKCDCGDQLRSTVQAMAEGEGGVLLYLDQEGRGNGLANKMRAYKLQSEGWDTYDADEALGFGPDQRRFDYAAEMLAQLGITQVRVMTNNPEKIAALRNAGLDVVADDRAYGRPTRENIRYLAAKRDRAGHYIDLEALLARSPPRE